MALEKMGVGIPCGIHMADRRSGINWLGGSTAHEGGPGWQDKGVSTKARIKDFLAGINPYFLMPMFSGIVFSTSNSIY